MTILPNKLRLASESIARRIVRRALLKAGVIVVRYLSVPQYMTR